MSTIKTRCGKSSLEERRLYKLTTDDVQMYIRKKVRDAAMRYINAHPNGEAINDDDEDIVTTQNGKNPKKKNRIEFTMQDAQEALNFDPAIITAHYGNKFRPFTIMIDCAFMKNNRKRKNNYSELSMFRPQEQNGHNIRLNSFVYAVIKSFGFTRDDVQFITSPSNGNTLHLSRNATAKFKKNYELAVTEVNHNHYVTCLLNPISIFHDMVYDIDNPTEFYRTDVDSINDVNSYKTEYMVVRYPDSEPTNKHGKKNKGGGDKAALARRISC